MSSSSLLAVRRPLRPDPDETERLWAYYVHTRDAAVRDKLTEAYMEFARMMAAKVYARRIFAHLEFDDYLQYATIGLIESIDRFDPARGIKFETFASSRINGAMLSGIDCGSEVHEQIRARKRVINARLQLLLEEQDGAGSVFARLAEIALGLAVGFALEDTGMHCEEEGRYPDNSYAAVEMKQLQVRLHQALALLPPAQRQVIHAHYVQQQPFEEVAESMALSRGRISQIHKQALGSLRNLLGSGQELDLHF